MQAEDSDRIVVPNSKAGRHRRVAVLIVLAGVLSIAALLMLGDRWLRKPSIAVPESVTSNDTPPASTMPHTQPAPTSDAELAAHAPNAEAAIALPALADSDDEVRRTLTGILPAALHSVLVPSDLLARAAALTDSLAHGRLVRDKLPLPAPSGKTMIIERDGMLFLDPANHTRYDALTAVLESIDAGVLARWYLHYEPLLQQAYEELGNGDARVREALLAGIDTMLTAPIAPAEIELVQPAVFYKFADPDLESLPATRKLLLRIGPRNREILTSWLANFASRLR